MAMTIFWTNKKGAHAMRTFSDPEMCWSFMDTLRTRAVVKENGEVVGRIEHRTDGHQDQPGCRQWFGWLDMGWPVLRKDYEDVPHD